MNKTATHLEAVVVHVPVKLGKVDLLLAHEGAQAGHEAHDQEGTCAHKVSVHRSPFKTCEPFLGIKKQPRLISTKPALKVSLSLPSLCLSKKRVLFSQL